MREDHSEALSQPARTVGVCMKMSLGMEISGSFEDLYEHAEKRMEGKQ